MIRELQTSIVFQPLNTVAWIQHEIVERVTVGKDDVLVAVRIQISQLNPVESVSQIGRFPEDSTAEERAGFHGIMLVQEHHNLLVFLADQGDKIYQPVAGQVMERQMTGSRSTVQVDLLKIETFVGFRDVAQ